MVSVVVNSQRARAWLIPRVRIIWRELMKSLTGSIVGAVVLVLTIAMLAYPQDRKSDANIGPFAAGSILAISTSGTGDQAIYCEEPEVKKVGDTWFIVGKYASLPGTPTLSKTLKVWVALNSITMINEYKDGDELRRGAQPQTQPAS